MGECKPECKENFALDSEGDGKFHFGQPGTFECGNLTFSPYSLIIEKFLKSWR